MGFDIKQALRDYLESNGSIEFDLYAQDIEEWLWLQELIPGIVVSSAGGIGLFQAEGLIEEYPFYFRAEQDYSSICIAQPNGSPFMWSGDVLWNGSNRNPELPFHLSSEDFVKELLACLSNLERSKFYWRFEGKELQWNDEHNAEAGWIVTDKPLEVGAYGHSPAEAFAEAARPKEALASYAGVTLELQRKMWIDQQVSPVPLNEDKRVWPDPAPEFVRLSGLN